MRISKVKQLDDGIKDVQTNGWVKTFKPPRHLEGTSQSTGRDYDFWTQFLVLQDGADDKEDSIGVDISLNSETDAIKQVRVKLAIKGMVDSYEKGGYTNKKLARCKIVGGQVPRPPSSDKPKDPPPFKDEKDTIYGKCFTMLAAGALGNVSPMALVEDMAELRSIHKLVGYCMNGLPPEPKKLATPEKIDAAKEEALAAHAVRDAIEDEYEEVQQEEEPPF